MAKARRTKAVRTKTKAKSKTKPRPVAGKAGRKIAKARPAKVVSRVTLAPSSKTKASAKSPVLLKPRSKVAAADTWNLTSLFPSDAEWENAFVAATEMVPGYAYFNGRLGEGGQTLAEALQYDADVSRYLERLGTYTSLRTSEDQGDSVAQRLKGRYMHLATQASEASAYMRPEILAIPAARLADLVAEPVLAGWRLAIERIVRYRPHTLSPAEENLLAKQGQMSEAAPAVFRQLNDADLKFGTTKSHDGRTVELGHSNYSMMLQGPKRDVRSAAFHQYYSVFESHKNTLAAAFNASVQKDIYYARVRNHATAREAALFADDVPATVYDNLISAVRGNLPAVHRYYKLRRKAMKLKDLHFYDTYTPMVSGVEKEHSWDQAVKVVVDSLAPLGDKYCSALHAGLTKDRWCDRYANAGKQSGAYSSGCFDSNPFILMNYEPKVLRSVFTLTHEAGHSMHSWHSNHTQPYVYADYTIFVAEVASTFNEQLLAEHLANKATTRREKAFLINGLIDDVRATIVRQTMFAEFEHKTHAIAESGEPLTVELVRKTYRALLNDYFGPDFAIDPVLELEGLRIPHFYRAFYVYKYATGLSAAIALSRKVLSGEAGALDRYITFLSSGCSKFPLELLADAGVDMRSPEPVNTALAHFNHLVAQLEELLD